MTYRSHTGKTKTGETYEKFLGAKDYNEKLENFESFLHASFCKLSPRYWASTCTHVFAS